MSQARTTDLTTMPVVDKQVPAWQYMAAHDGFISSLQVALAKGLITDTYYTHTVDKMLAAGRRLDELIARHLYHARYPHPWPGDPSLIIRSYPQGAPS